MGTNSVPLLADLFLHTFEYDFLLKTMRADLSKAVEYSNTFRYIDDLFSVNNDNFGKSIREIYPSELELKDNNLSSKEVCYLDTKISHGDSSTSFRIDVYDKREDFYFRIVNFPFMDSKNPANLAYGVYISQLVRCARICTAKVDFMRRLCSLASRLQQQGFKSTLLVKSINKFFKRHCTTMVKYNVTLRKLRSAVRH